MLRRLYRRRYQVGAPFLVLMLCIVTFLLLRSSILIAHSSEGQIETEQTIQSPADGSTDSEARLPSTEPSIIDSVRTTLSLRVSTPPDTEEYLAKAALAEADGLREGMQGAGAMRAYITIMDEYPDTLQAEAADSEYGHMLETRTLEQFDELEAVLPPIDQFSSSRSLTAVAALYFRHAVALADSQPERAAEYFDGLCDFGWNIFLGNLDDDYKMTVLEAYLAAADAAGRSEEIRAKLSTYAKTLEPCFTAWLIKAEIDKQEPPFDFVTSVQARSAVMKYYMKRAQNAGDGEERPAYYTKARDAAWQILAAQPSGKPAFGLANNFLGAASGLGEDARQEAIAQLEELIATQPPSVMRWITRYELAESLTQSTDEEDTKAGYHHFETMIEEAESCQVASAITDETIDLETRALVLCVLGHAYYGTNRLEEAEAHYVSLLELFPFELHAGESAAYSLAEVVRRKNFGKPDVIVRTFESFASDHPSSFYAPLALIRAGQEREGAGNAASAAANYARVITEYPESSYSDMARSHLDAVDDNTQQSL